MWMSYNKICTYHWLSLLGIVGFSKMQHVKYYLDSLIRLHQHQQPQVDNYPKVDRLYLYKYYVKVSEICSKFGILHSLLAYGLVLMVLY